MLPHVLDLDTFKEEFSHTLISGKYILEELELKKQKKSKGTIAEDDLETLR